MKNNIRKLKTLVFSMLLLGTLFFVPAGSVNIKTNINISPDEDLINEEFINEFLDFDTKFIVNPAHPQNRNGDNDDAGYKEDVGDEIKRSYPIYPNEMIDNWPGRGNTGKLSSSDEEDWYTFPICSGQDVSVTMTPEDGFDFDISLFNKYEEEKASSTNSGSTAESFTFTVDISSNWYLQVKYISGTGEGQYTFDVDITTQNDANTGDDAGDDFSSATPIIPGEYEGFLDMNDEEDWYKFNVESGQGIHVILGVRKVAYQSDFDIYLYDPTGELAHYENFYYDDELLYPADMTGEWRVKIDIYPGYSDIPQPTEWEYFTYGSGPYEMELILESSAPAPPGPIPQPDITTVSQTFKIENNPSSSKDDFAYLASIPACNYLEGGNRHLAPIVYTGDSTPTNWVGTVDDTTNYLLDDWNDYLTAAGKTASEYLVPDDPIKAAAEISTNLWESSDLAVVAVDGSSYDDTSSIVLDKTKTLTRKISTETISSDSDKFKEFGGYFARLMILGPGWGAIQVAIKGAGTEPSFIGIIPHYMQLANDWWPEHVEEKTDIYHPIPTFGIYAASVFDLSETWDMEITKFGCHRHKINVQSSD